MTIEISDTARELALKFAKHFVGEYCRDDEACGSCVEFAQTALTAARNSGVEQMREMIIEHINNDYSEELATGLEQEIRAMKVQI